MNNEINFGIEGPVVTGWWYNPKTGDKFNAIDTFFEDNNLLIKTADGKLLNYNQIQNYVRTDDPKSIPNKPIVTKPKKQDDSIPAEILAEIEDQDTNDLLIPDDNIFSDPVKRRDAVSTTTLSTAPGKPLIDDFDIINRALGSKSRPTIKGDIIWRAFPVAEIKMLIDMMGVKKSDIIEYYIDNISIKDIENAIKETIKKYVLDKLTPETDEKKKTKTK